MRVVINGREQAVEGSVTVSDLLRRLEIAGPSVAVELNRNILPKTQHENTLLQEGDRLEIVTLVGGG